MLLQEILQLKDFTPAYVTKILWLICWAQLAIS